MHFFKPEREERVDLTSSDTESLDAQACLTPLPLRVTQVDVP